MNDDAQLSDDAELPDTALVRPYVESLGDFSTPAPELPAAEQPTALLPRVSATARKQRRVPEALEGEVVDLELPPTPPRTRVAVAAIGVAVVLVTVFLIWRPSGGSAKPASPPIAAVVPSLALPSPSPEASRTPAKPSLRPTRTPASASSSAVMSPMLAKSGNQDSSVDLAAGRPVTDTGHTQNYVASNVVDGDPNTYWEGRDYGFPQSLTIDLGAPMAVSRLVIKLPPQPDWKRRTQSISIEVNDKANGRYDTIVPVTIMTFDPATANEASIHFKAGEFRYVRITFMTNSAWPGGQASEVELYSS